MKTLLSFSLALVLYANSASAQSWEWTRREEPLQCHPFQETSQVATVPSNSPVFVGRIEINTLSEACARGEVNDCGTLLTALERTITSGTPVYPQPETSTLERALARSECIFENECQHGNSSLCAWVERVRAARYGLGCTYLTAPSQARTCYAYATQLLAPLRGWSTGIDEERPRQRLQPLLNYCNNSRHNADACVLLVALLDRYQHPRATEYAADMLGNCLNSNNLQSEYSSTLCAGLLRQRINGQQPPTSGGSFPSPEAPHVVSLGMADEVQQHTPLPTTSTRSTDRSQPPECRGLWFDGPIRLGVLEVGGGISVRPHSSAPTRLEASVGANLRWIWFELTLSGLTAFRWTFSPDRFEQWFIAGALQPGIVVHTSQRDRLALSDRPNFTFSFGMVLQGGPAFNVNTPTDRGVRPSNPIDQAERNSGGWYGAIGPYLRVSSSHVVVQVHALWINETPTQAEDRFVPWMGVSLLGRP